MTTRDQIQKLIGDLNNPEACDTLDELVRDQASDMASAVNNDGLSAQLEFLAGRGLDAEAVLKHLEEASE